jgi:hypothetical protein
MPDDDIAGGGREKSEAVAQAYHQVTWGAGGDEAADVGAARGSCGNWVTVCAEHAHRHHAVGFEARIKDVVDSGKVIETFFCFIVRVQVKSMRSL